MTYPLHIYGVVEDNELILLVHHFYTNNFVNHWHQLKLILLTHHKQLLHPMS
uniref:Uncharacterized protein n=1 Tax=Rhizophora mucronata TaxID=61149 RepID=A0A2P2QD35_RHIMU